MTPSRIEQDAAESGPSLGRSATHTNNQAQATANQNNNKDMYRRFSQKHDPKWAAMIALLAHGEVDEAIRKIEEQEEVMRKEKQQQGSVSKDYIVGQVNLLFAYAKCYLLKADTINFNKVAERLK